MFICSPCLEKNYTNWSAFMSYGDCEVCREPGACHDIPSKDLGFKKHREDVVVNTSPKNDTGVMIVAENKIKLKEYAKTIGLRVSDKDIEELTYYNDDSYGFFSEKMMIRSNYDTLEQTRSLGDCFHVRVNSETGSESISLSEAKELHAFLGKAIFYLESRQKHDADIRGLF